MQNLLLIGSEGSIGKYLNKFFKKKYNIFKIDNNKKFLNRKNYKNLDLSKDKIKNLKFNKKIDLVICLSFNLDFKKISTKQYFLEGRNIYKNIFEIIKVNNIKKIQYFSSFAVYGQNSKINREYDKPKPYNNYGKLKLETENKLVNFCKKNQLQYQIFRITNVYGPEIKSSIIYKIYQHKLKKTPFIVNNKGLSIRNFIHIYDLAQLSYKGFQSYHSGIFNATSNKNYKVIEVVKNFKLKYILNNKNFNEPKKLIGSSIKAKKKIGWIATKDIMNFKFN